MKRWLLIETNVDGNGVLRIRQTNSPHVLAPYADDPFAYLIDTQQETYSDDDTDKPIEELK